MEDPNFLQALLAPYLNSDIANIVTLVIAIGAAVSAAFPSKLGKETAFGKVLQFILDLANFAGINWGKAKNADDPDPIKGVEA